LNHLQKDPNLNNAKLVFFTKIPLAKIRAAIAAINSISAADAPHFTKLSMACTTGLF
jgi:hypothetical protein